MRDMIICELSHKRRAQRDSAEETSKFGLSESARERKVNLVLDEYCTQIKTILYYHNNIVVSLSCQDGKKRRNRIIFW